MHFLIQPANKNPKKQEAYEKLVEMSRNDDYTTGNLFDFLYHQNIRNSYNKYFSLN